MQFHFLFFVLLVPGSFSILNVVGTNILKTLNFNQTLSSNGSLENFSDSTFMKDYVEVLTLTASITFLTGIIQVEDESVLYLMMYPYVHSSHKCKNWYCLHILPMNTKLSTFEYIYCAKWDMKVCLLLSCCLKKIR